MPPPELVDLQCNNCGAELPPAVNGRYACKYCGRSYEISRPPPPPRPPPVYSNLGPRGPNRGPIRGSAPARAAGVAAAIQRVAKVMRVFIVVAVALSFGFGMLRAFLHAPGSSTINSPGVLTVPSVGSIFGAPAGRLLWDDVGGPPQPAPTPSGEVFVGRFRIGDKDELYVVATDATTMAARWRVGPLGSYSEGYQATHFAVVGTRVLLTDYKSVLHILDVATGKENSVARLTDRAAQVCALPASGGASHEAWVQVEDGQNVIVDAITGKARASARPTACPENNWMTRHHGGHARTPSGAEVRAPAIPNFQSDHVLVDGPNAVASGYKSPGTRIPQLAGLDLQAKTSKWLVPLETGDPATMQPTSHLADDLAGGRYVVAFDSVSAKPRLAAFDAASGTRTWEVGLPKQRGIESAGDLVATASRVYVVRSNNLEVFDARSGTFLGRVGSAWLENE